MQSGNSRKYLYLLPFVSTLTLIAGLWTGYFLSKHDNSSQARQKLDEVFEMIQDYYVDEVSMDSLVEMTIPELLKNLDPHSAYIPAKDRVAANRDLESSFFGVGIQFQMLNDTIYIVEVISGGAAESAGILAGDRIIAVDGENITGPEVTTDDVFKRLRGEKNTEVQLTVKRHNSPKPLSFDLIRTEIPVTPIDADYMLNDSTAYIRVSKFSDNTYTEFIKSLNKLYFNGARSLVLDLRGNGGGYMNPAVLMANEFFSDNSLLVMTRGRNFAENSVIPSDMNGSFSDMQIVVLIDEFTASASEIFSGAIQDNDRGLIVGRRSFGKGLVQRQFDMPDSSQFRLTVQRYFTPSGRCIQKDYAPGKINDYDAEIFNRYSNGEIFSADSVMMDSTKIHHTMNGRPVYGGGGIMPDVFVPSDTSGMSPYYIKILNGGLIQKYAYEYCDLNRDQLSEARNLKELLPKLPSDGVLLQSFVSYARNVGNVKPQWYYIEQSRKLIVNQIKAVIARDILGFSAYYEYLNATDPVVLEALRQLQKGNARYPILPDDGPTTIFRKE